MAMTRKTQRNAGFSLVEVLLALSLGVWLSGTILQLLLTEAQLGLRMGRVLRERSLQQRTLALVRGDVQRASRISTTPLLEQHACSLAGRLPVLHLSTAAGPITYSVGAAPSGIWRGQVLMRCGPAFDLQGQPSLGTAAQNRVVIDGLATKPEAWQGCRDLVSRAAAAQELSGSSKQPFSACLDATGAVLAIRLLQDFPSSDGRSQRISRDEVMSALV